MTLIIGIANRQQVILVSDRRLSRNGVIVEDTLNKLEDESNKAAVFICQDARLAVAFTGLAQVGDFSTRRWLLAALSESAQPDYLMGPTIQRFCARASHDISKLSLVGKTDKRLSIVMAGYSYDDVHPRCYFWLVSNFEGLGEQYPILSESLDEFNIHYYREKRPTDEPLGIIIPFGASKAITKEHVLPLQDMLQRNKPANAIVDKSVEVLRTVADSPLSGNTIGKQCTSIILPSDPNLPSITQYHSNKATTKIFEPSFVEARGGEYGVYIIDTPEHEFRDSSDRPMIAKVPKVGRNDLCPCGSGKRYKRCHGQF